MNNRPGIMTRIIRRNWGGITATIAAIASAAIFLVLLAVSAFAFGPLDVAVTPAVIDIEGLPRDIIEREIVVRNLTDRRQYLYGMVRNLTAEGGVETFTEPNAPETDKTTSLANWIHLSRGLITLEPFEERAIPISVHIGLRAVTGDYHALITFPPSLNMTVTEERTAGSSEIVMSLRVTENIQESLSLLGFQVTHALSSSDPVTLTYQIGNGGNRPIKPRGNIILYDRRGDEIGAVPINTEGVTIPPGEKVALASIWDVSSARTGRFKAYLDMRYGDAGLKSVQDTVFFWVVPLPTLAIVFGLLLAGSISGLFFMQRRNLVRHRVRIDDWHQESMERHGGRQKQRTRGLPESPHRNVEAPTPTPIPKRGPRVSGNTIDLRSEDNQDA